MANYNLVVNSTFQPFSYERYMQPILEYEKDFNKTDAEYATIAEKAAELEKLKDSEIDKESYKEYKKWYDDVMSARDNMYKRGLTASDRAKLMKARASFASTITPMQQALEKREKEQLLQYQAKMANPYIKFSRDAVDTSLSAYMAGMPDIQVLDGTKLSEMARQMAAPIAQSMLEGSIKDGSLYKILPYQYIQELQKGASPQRFMQYLAEAANGNPTSPAAQMIKHIQDTVLKTSGLDSWDEKARAANDSFARNMINVGLNAMIGATTVEKYNDSYGMQEQLAQNNFGRDIQKMQMEYALKEAAAAKAAAGESSGITFGSPLMEGATTEEEDESFKRLEGLKDAGNGKISTNKLDGLRAQLSNYEATLKNLEKKYPGVAQKTAEYDKNMDVYNARGNKNMKLPAGASEYKSIKAKMAPIEKQINQEQMFVDNMANQNSYFGLKSPYKNLERARALYYKKRSRANWLMPLNASKADYDNIRHGLKTAFSTYTEDAINGGNVGFYDSKGNHMDYDDMQEMFENDNWKNIPISISKKTGALTFTYDGKTWTTKGSQLIDALQKDLSGSQQFLTDFSKGQMKGKTKHISKKSYDAIMQGSIPNHTDAGAVKLANGMYGAQLFVPETGESLKLLYGRDGSFLGHNTLNDELTTGGAADDVFKAMAGKSLATLGTVTAGK